MVTGRGQASASTQTNTGKSLETAAIQVRDGRFGGEGLWGQWAPLLGFQFARS